MQNKQTKIVATISDRRCDIKFLQQLYDNGMNVARINTAHQQPEDTEKIIHNIRQVSDKIAILIDTKGPEVRTSSFEQETTFHTGDKVQVRSDDLSQKSNRECIQVSYTHFVAEVNANDQILLDDGALILHVLEKHDDHLLCEVQNETTLKDRKSVNVPNVNLKLAALTKKDEQYVKFAIEHDVEFIAHSFVRTKHDVAEIQEILDKHNAQVKIIAKIENQEGIDNIDEILDSVYGVMIARGDLGVELPQEEIPIVQKMLIKQCNKRGKPVIVATQMLQSMIHNPRPTRAEINDIATAIYDGADAVMLSGETSYGKYPIECVQTMAKVAKKVEASVAPTHYKKDITWNHQIMRFMARRAIDATIDLPVKAIITATRTGATARIVSAHRATIPIHAKCFSQRVMRELALVHGVFPSYFEQQNSTDDLVSHALEELVQNNDLDPKDLVVILGSTPGLQVGIDFMEIKTVEVGISNSTNES